VALMNRRAKELGMKSSQFGNSNGWPDEGRTIVTARDLATLAEATIEKFPDLYKKFYSLPSFTWGKTLGAAPRSPSRTAIRCSAACRAPTG
jgi:D-alanyl-D-alanine carboxypeptidase (penicillin-binding protein 5/6)